MRKGKRHLLLQTHRRFKRAVVELVKSEQGPKAIGYAATLLLCLLAINALNIVNSYVGRDFFSAIERRDVPRFQYQAFLYAVVFIASAFVGAWNNYTEGRLGILWRQQLTWRISQAFMRDRTYYHLDGKDGVQNPDQRIAEDIRGFTGTTLSFTLIIINGVLTVVSFSGVLWSISPRLFVVAVAYAAFGSLLTVWLGKPLIRLNYRQLDLEANFRSDLIHIRENSESIALSHREERFRNRLHRQLSDVVGNFRRIIRVSRNMAIFTNSYNYFIQIIPALIIAPLFIKGHVEFGVISQSAMAFSALLGAFSIIVTQFGSISSFTAITARLHHLSDAIDHSQPAAGCSTTRHLSADTIAFENVTLRKSAESPPLVSELSFTMHRGERWLVTGNDDAVKLAVFRAAAGIWDCGSGDIHAPDLEDVLFLPERPYLPPFSIRHLLVRAAHEGGTTDAEIHDVLARLDLAGTIARVGGLDVHMDWDDSLSIGEQHMLSIARIFLAKPAFVLLDRPGSAISPDKLGLILGMLRERGIGVAIFSNNGEANADYDHHLILQSDGAWEITAPKVQTLPSRHTA